MARAIRFSPALQLQAAMRDTLIDATAVIRLLALSLSLAAFSDTTLPATSQMYIRFPCS